MVILVRFVNCYPTAMASSKDPQSNIPASSKGSWSSFLKVSVLLPVMYLHQGENWETLMPSMGGMAVLLRCQLPLLEPLRLTPPSVELALKNNLG